MMSNPFENTDENVDNQDVQDDQNVDDQNFNDDQDFNDEPQVSESTKKALSLGWKPKDEWEGDPDEWSSENRFLQTRDIIESNKQLRSNQDRMEHEFTRRLDGVNRLHEQNLKIKIDELKATRDNAASEADMETYEATNKKLDELENQTVTPAPQPENNQQNLVQGVVNHPVTQQFISDNPWIKGSAAKAVYGQKIFSDWLQQNSTNPNAMLEEGLQLVKDSVGREFQNTNPNRQKNQQMGDRGTGNRTQAPRNRLSMNDLSRAELGIWRSMGSTYKNEAEFLLAVADSRKGE